MTELTNDLIDRSGPAQRRRREYHDALGHAQVVNPISFTRGNFTRWPEPPRARTK